MNPRQRLRAVGRMARLASLTRRACRRLAADPDARHPEAATRHGHLWAQELVTALGIDVQVRGKMPGGPVLLLANHRSYVDIPLLLAQRPCAFLAKREIGAWPVFGAAARLNHTVFVDRDCRDSRKAARESALRLLEQGVGFAAFPEGTTSAGPGARPFYPGLFDLAAAHGFPVVPVAIEYEFVEDAWIDDDPFVGHFLRRFGRERVRARLAIGPTFHVGEVPDLKLASEDWILEQLG